MRIVRQLIILEAKLSKDINMFQITQEILEKTEASLLGITNKNWAVRKLYIYLIFPWKYLVFGLGVFFKPIYIWALLSFLLLLLFVFVIPEFDLDPKYSLLILNVCLYIPLFLVIFAVPSTYSYYGVELKNVKQVSEFIESVGLDSIEKIELLEKSIDSIYIRISSRVSFYRWGIGIVWALYLLFFNIEVKYIIADSKGNLSQILMENFTSFIPILLSTLLAFVLVIGYKRASEALIKSLEFGCIEQKYILLKNMPNKKIQRTL